MRFSCSSPASTDWTRSKHIMGNCASVEPAAGEAVYLPHPGGGGVGKKVGRAANVVAPGWQLHPSHGYAGMGL